jgi:hypothetical protein
VRNTEAYILYTNRGKVVLNDIMGTKMFNFAKAKTVPGWYKELIEKHTPETK